jgi:hypothetical protein
VLDSLCEIHSCFQNSPEHTQRPTTRVQHFSAEFLFIYFRKQGLVILILIFQNFSNWGISMQNTFCIVHL